MPAMERTDCPVLVVSGADFSGTCAVQEFDLDCAFGVEDGSENDFTATFAEPLLSGGELLMIEGTEYGGVVDRVKTATSSREAEYSGRTWHGMLAEKVLCPDAGQDYLSVSGDANACLATIVSRCGLGSVFKVRSASSGIAVKHTFDRYCDAWTGVTTMLRRSGAKLAMSAGQGGVEMWAEPVASLGSDVDSDAMDFDCETIHRQVNHLVGLGDGELRDRAVSHWYADGSGNVSQTRTYSGADEIAEVYDYSNADAEKLAEETKKKLQDLQGTGTISFTVADIGDDARIGDVVTARDNRTGRTVTAPVTKKVAKVEDGVLTVSYSIGEESAGSSTLSGSAEANAGTVYTAGDGISITSGRISADVTQAELDAVSAAAQSASSTAAAAKAKADSWSLPAATSSTLGGVKVGSNLTISSGTLSMSKANVVSALGFTPTNFTIEQGTNSNGSWFKFSSGLLICTKRLTFDTSCTSAWASMFETPKLSLGAPAATFKSTPVVSVSNVSGNAGFIENVNGASASSLGAIYVARPNSVGSISYTVNVIAVGVWK